MHEAELRQMVTEAKIASRVLARITTEQKNRALRAMAKALETRSQEIYDANGLDVEDGRKAGLTKVLVDRLMITYRALDTMIRTFHAVAEMRDPVGEVESVERLGSGLEITSRRVPLGVVALIVESRPASSGDAAALGLKSGNSMFVRGGSEAVRSNLALQRVLRDAATAEGIPPAAFQVVPWADRSDVKVLLEMEGLIDLVVPRGGAGLIELVRRHARMPVLFHGPGVCHLYVDEFADLDLAKNLLFDGKARVPAVCNATEAVLVHQAVAKEFWTKAESLMRFGAIEVHGDPRTCEYLPWAEPATPEDYGKEFLRRALAARVVDSFDEALEHIARYGTRHTEVIATRDLERARRFADEVDAGAVVINGSSRLNEGIIIGAGGHLGISTSKIHAFGTMGVRELTSVKRIITASGHVRAY